MSVNIWDRNVSTKKISLICPLIMITYLVEVKVGIVIYNRTIQNNIKVLSLSISVFTIFIFKKVIYYKLLS